ncbi:histone-lysine_N-methyltransferase 2A-like isoform X2 [Hexamita inflata]|uniref:Histone-lysine N-methyltransferase 2A-like isoform X2 n=1 Tax=Hexamita inflata TaxID=28002 RepID=A0AA86RJT8_9EUKA|nr:histone-lysine N-methyltransferase 2A-like isoform X2 [Hexamita inflata]
MSNFEREKQLARETQQRLKRIEQQRQIAEKAEQQKIIDVKEQKRQIINDNEPFLPPPQYPGHDKTQDSKKTVQDDFQRFLRNVQQASGNQVSMDLSYLQPKPQSAPRQVLQPLNQIQNQSQSKSEPRDQPKPISQQVNTQQIQPNTQTQSYQPISKMLEQKSQQSQLQQTQQQQSQLQNQQSEQRDDDYMSETSERIAVSLLPNDESSSEVNDSLMNSIRDLTSKREQQRKPEKVYEQKRQNVIDKNGKLVYKEEFFNSLHKAQKAIEQKQDKNQMMLSQKEENEPKITAKQPQQKTNNIHTQNKTNVQPNTAVKQSAAVKQEPKKEQPKVEAKVENKSNENIAKQTKAQPIQKSQVNNSQVQNSQIVAQPPKPPKQPPKPQPKYDPLQVQIKQLTEQENQLESQIKEIDNQIRQITVDNLNLSNIEKESVISIASPKQALPSQIRESEMPIDSEDSSLTAEQKTRLKEEKVRQYNEFKQKQSRQIINESVVKLKKNELQYVNPLEPKNRAKTPPQQQKVKAQQKTPEVVQSIINQDPTTYSTPNIEQNWEPIEQQGDIYANQELINAMFNSKPPQNNELQKSKIPTIESIRPAIPKIDKPIQNQQIYQTQVDNNYEQQLMDTRPGVELDQIISQYQEDYEEDYQAGLYDYIYETGNDVDEGDYDFQEVQ